MQEETTNQESTEATNEETTQEAPQGYSSEAQTLINLDSLIKNHLVKLGELRDKNKEMKEQLEDIFVNDPVYNEHAEKAKEATKTKSQTKQQLMKQPVAQDLSEKLKLAKSEARELQQSLSDYLQEYQRLTGANEFEDANGEVRDIRYTAKLVKKSFR